MSKINCTEDGEYCGEYTVLIDTVWYERLGFCGCWDTDEIFESMYQALMLIKRFGMIYDIPKTVFNLEDRGDLLLSYTLDGAKLTQHGTSIGTSSLTEEGELFITDWEGIKNKQEAK